MKTATIIASLAFASGIAFAAGPAPWRVEKFNLDWRFAKGAQPGAESVGFDDSAWEPVRLPHDWAIRGPYDIQGEPRSGKLPWRGEAWYRKSFSLPASDAGKRVYLDFDGVMAMPTVYVNGRRAGGWDYGYISFRVDVTDRVALFYGKAMLIVRVGEGQGGEIRVTAKSEGLREAATIMHSGNQQSLF